MSKRDRLSELLGKARTIKQEEVCVYCKKEEPDALIVVQVPAHVECYVATQAAKKETVN